MMFAAGLGLGLLFYGVAEPISHFAAPPHGLAEPRSRRRRSARARDDVLPLGLQRLGDLRGGGPRARVLHLPAGPADPRQLDVRAAARRSCERAAARAARSTGSRSSRRCSARATSLGLGALQINSGLNFLWDVPIDERDRRRDHRRSSPRCSSSPRCPAWRRGSSSSATSAAGDARADGVLPRSSGRRCSSSARRSRRSAATSSTCCRELPHRRSSDPEWMAAWTIFYWAWWISWAPFVGTFVARISRGRTIREFILGVVAMPTGLGLHLVRDRRGDRDRPADERAGRPRRDGGDAGAVAVRRARAAAVHDGDVGPVADPDRALLHQRRGRRVDRDGDARLARQPRAVKGGRRGARVA